MPWTVVVCHGCNAINPSFPPYRHSPVLCWRLCCSKMAFPSQTHYAEFCLFLVRCLLLPSIAQNGCGEMQGSGRCCSAFPLCARRALGVCGCPGQEKGWPHGWHIREHLRTTAYHSSQVTDLSWALMQVLLCLSAWCREVGYIFLFFTPLGIKEMTLSIMFGEVLLGSTGTICTFSSCWLTPGKLNHELFLFTG